MILSYYSSSTDITNEPFQCHRTDSTNHNLCQEVSLAVAVIYDTILN